MKSPLFAVAAISTLALSACDKRNEEAAITSEAVKNPAAVPRESPVLPPTGVKTSPSPMPGTM